MPQFHTSSPRPPPPQATVPPSRLLADRRSGADQRLAPRRALLSAVSIERRRIVDRRRGAERRSTLDRRGRGARQASVESPAEHVRNGLQLLLELSGAAALDADRRADLAAALDRLRRALWLLERRSPDSRHRDADP